MGLIITHRRGSRQAQLQKQRNLVTFLQRPQVTKTTHVKEQSGCEEKMFVEHIKEAVVFGEDVFTQQISRYYVLLAFEERMRD